MARMRWGICCILALAAAMPAAGFAAEIVGAGSSFTAVVMQAWAQRFELEHKVAVQYRSVGSGEGIRRVTARSVDFAMTDIPLTQAELMQDDLLQFPVVVGAIVPVLNLPGPAAGIRLSGTVLGDIFLGKISQWDDPALRALNPGVALPGLPISVVHRDDGSGTTFVFTHYLSKVNAEWQDRLGVGSRLLWPAGKGAKGNEGVAQQVHDTVGAIGYVEYSYAQKYRLATVSLANGAGKYVAGDEAGARAALASTSWSRASYYEVITDRPGDASWPIVGVSFALVHRNQPSLDDARETLSFMDWIFHHGASIAAENRYIPLDDKGLIRRIESSWKDIRDRSGQVVWKNNN
jgi:phosphate transport system substrate-binding protein